MSNRIQAALIRTETRIKERLAARLVTQAQIDALHTTLDMGAGEHAKFQELKSLAFANGELNLEEAQQLYMLLGNQVGVYNSQPIHVKSILTQMYAELLKKHMGQRKAG